MYFYAEISLALIENLVINVTYAIQSSYCCIHIRAYHYQHCPFEKYNMLSKLAGVVFLKPFVMDWTGAFNFNP